MKENLSLLIVICFVYACANGKTEQNQKHPEVFKPNEFIENTAEQNQKCQESRRSNKSIGYHNPVTGRVDTSAEEIYMAHKGAKLYDNVYFEKTRDLMTCKTFKQGIGFFMYVERKIDKTAWKDIVAKFNKINFWCIEEKAVATGTKMIDGGGFSLEAKKGAFRHNLDVPNPRFDDVSIKTRDSIQGDKKRIEGVVDELLAFGNIDITMYLQIKYEQQDRIYTITISPNEHLSVKTFDLYINRKKVKLTNNVYKMTINEYDVSQTVILCKILTKENEQIHYNYRLKA